MKPENQVAPPSMALSPDVVTQQIEEFLDIAESNYSVAAYELIKQEIHEAKTLGRLDEITPEQLQALFEGIRQNAYQAELAEIRFPMTSD